MQEAIANLTRGPEIIARDSAIIIPFDVPTRDLRTGLVPRKNLLSGSGQNIINRVGAHAVIRDIVSAIDAPLVFASILTHRATTNIDWVVVPDIIRNIVLHSHLIESQGALHSTSLRRYG